MMSFLKGLVILFVCQFASSTTINVVEVPDFDDLFVSSSPMTFEEAEVFCHENDGMLAAAQDLTQYLELSQTFVSSLSSNKIWFGVYSDIECQTRFYDGTVLQNQGIFQLVPTEVHSLCEADPDTPIINLNKLFEPQAAGTEIMQLIPKSGSALAFCRKSQNCINGYVYDGIEEYYCRDQYSIPQYFISKDPMSFTDALEYCGSFGFSLASPYMSQDFYSLFETLDTMEEELFWMGFIKRLAADSTCEIIRPSGSLIQSFDIEYLLLDSTSLSVSQFNDYICNYEKGILSYFLTNDFGGLDILYSAGYATEQHYAICSRFREDCADGLTFYPEVGYCTSSAPTTTTTTTTQTTIPTSTATRASSDVTTNPSFTISSILTLPTLTSSTSSTLETFTSEGTMTYSEALAYCAYNGGMLYWPSSQDELNAETTGDLFRSTTFWLGAEKHNRANDDCVYRQPDSTLISESVVKQYLGVKKCERNSVLIVETYKALLSPKVKSVGFSSSTNPRHRALCTKPSPKKCHLDTYDFNSDSGRCGCPAIDQVCDDILDRSHGTWTPIREDWNAEMDCQYSYVVVNIDSVVPDAGKTGENLVQKLALESKLFGARFEIADVFGVSDFEYEYYGDTWFSTLTQSMIEDMSEQEYRLTSPPVYIHENKYLALSNTLDAAGLLVRIRARFPDCVDTSSRDFYVLIIFSSVLWCSSNTKIGKVPYQYHIIEVERPAFQVRHHANLTETGSSMNRLWEIESEDTYSAEIYVDSKFKEDISVSVGPYPFSQKLRVACSFKLEVYPAHQIEIGDIDHQYIVQDDFAAVVDFLASREETSAATVLKPFEFVPNIMSLLFVPDINQGSFFTFRNDFDSSVDMSLGGTFKICSDDPAVVDIENMELDFEIEYFAPSTPTGTINADASTTGTNIQFISELQRIHGGCAEIKFNSLPLDPTSYLVSSLWIRLRPTNTRRVVNNEETSEQSVGKFSFSQGDALYVTAKPASDGGRRRAIPDALAQDPGSLVVIFDSDPPVIDCPTSPDIVRLSFGQVDAIHTWQLPQVRDQGSFTVFSNYEPSGTDVNINDSPYEVEIVAQDQAGNTAVCEFLIVVEIEQSPAVANIPISDFMFPSEQEQVLSNPVFVTNVYSDIMFRDTIDTNVTANSTAVSAFTVNFFLSENYTFELNLRDQIGVDMRLLFEIEVQVAGEPGLDSSEEVDDVDASVNFVSVQPQSFSSAGILTTTVRKLYKNGNDLAGARIVGYSKRLDGLSTLTFDALEFTIAAPSLYSLPSSQVIVNADVQFAYTYTDLATTAILPDSFFRSKFLTVQDATPPVFISCASPSGTTYTVDHVPGVITLTKPSFVIVSDPESEVFVESPSDVYPATYPDAPITVSFIATNRANLQANCSMDVLVRDVEPPLITECTAETTLPDGEDLVQISIDDVTIIYQDDTRDEANIEYLFLNSPQNRNGFAAGSHSMVDAIRIRDAWNNTAHCNLNFTVVAAATATGANSDTVIIGAALGGVCALILLILIVVIIVFKRRANKPHDFAQEAELLQDRVDDESGFKRPEELRRSDIQVLDEIGSGQFGTVNKGIYRPRGGNQTTVAIKCLKVSGGRQEMLEEAALMAQFDHVNIVGLVGVVTVGEPLLMVLEYCENGSLKSYLEKKGAQLSKMDRTTFSLQCAQGLEYLSAKGYVHRDIAARNVLVDPAKRCKVSDFGLSRQLDNDEYYRSQGGAIPVRWTAPECLSDKKFTSASDVWAFGVLLYEIWTNADLPYKGWNNSVVWLKVTEGYRLPCPENCPAEMHAVMMLCWAAEPEERATFTQLCSTLRKQQTQMMGNLTSMKKPAPQQSEQLPHGVQPNDYRDRANTAQRVNSQGYVSVSGENGSDYEYSSQRASHADVPTLIPASSFSSEKSPYLVPSPVNTLTRMASEPSSDSDNPYLTPRTDNIGYHEAENQGNDEYELPVSTLERNKQTVPTVDVSPPLSPNKDMSQTSFYSSVADQTLPEHVQFVGDVADDISATSDERPYLQPSYSMGDLTPSERRKKGPAFSIKSLGETKTDLSNPGSQTTIFTDQASDACNDEFELLQNALASSADEGSTTSQNKRKKSPHRVEFI